MDIQSVYQALCTLRAPRIQGEYDLHALLSQALQESDISFTHEAKLAPRCRIDFLCGDVGIEVKRGRPNLRTLQAQIGKYLESDSLQSLIVVVERAANLPGAVRGKPVQVLSLNKLWGIAAAADETTDKQEEILPPLPVPDDTVSSADTVDAPDASVHQDDGSAFYEDIPEGGIMGGSEETAEEDADCVQGAPSAQEYAPIEESVLRHLETEELPVYLRTESYGGHVFGTLSYNRRRKCWTIKGEPCVTEMAKRLFPGSAGARRGEARFTAHRRVVGDVNWLMQRYPLDIVPQDRALWQEALRGAQEYYRAREKARIAPPLCQPDKTVFEGTLRPFQQQGVSWLNLTPRALLADEMGLGKTVQALASLAVRKLYPAIIVVPPHLTLNWKAEAARFLRVEGKLPRIHILQGLKPYPLPEADVYIVHYLLLRGWKEALPKYEFKAVVFDEIQELRHAGTEKYSAASLLSDSSENVLGLSGTPIYNQGGEIWNVVNVLDFHFLGDWESFSREWCAGYGNNIVLKPDILGGHLRREGLMLRRTKKEVLPELPEKRRLVQEIDADDSIYEQLMKPVVQKLALWQTDSTMTASARALLEDQISQEERQATGIAKAPYVCQFVRALVQSGEKVLLFAHHHKVMDLYKKELSALRPAFITGRETAAQKEAAVERFMEGKTDLCCISLRAASGLNLQRASCVVFGELDWSPAVHSQAEDRAHRIGQKDSLLCYYLVSPRGSDADMQEALGLKVSQFLGLMGERPESEAQSQQSASIAKRHVENLIRRLDAEKLRKE